MLSSLRRDRGPTRASTAAVSAAECGSLLAESRRGAATGIVDKTRPLQSARMAGAGAGIKFMDLPTEIHLMVSRLLIYPDALSLKHCSSYLYHLVDTGVTVKVEWLVLRRSLHLKCPNDRKCDLGSDLRFCRGSVPLLIQHYRNHLECEARPGIGCMIYNTKVCFHRRTPADRMRQWLRAVLLRDAPRLIIGALVLAVCWLAGVGDPGERGAVLRVAGWEWWMVPLSVTCVAILAVDAVRLARSVYRRRTGVVREW
ncbi:uncharacterized protein BROUX77_007493 [Berkeleyomyces rouxiae]|uniref:uncharacterized protein n=1 Tax=Berkeleyomyces rouxiae TaxID=2035830 RepID=UPI003B75FAF8